MILTRTTFQQALSPARLRVMQIIHGALIGGPLVFLLALFAVMQSGETGTADPQAVDTVTLLSLVNAVYALVSFGAGMFLFGRVFHPDRLHVPETPAHGMETEQSALALLQTALLLRMGLLEGAAILGLAVCLIAWTTGVLAVEQLYWLNAGSVVLLLVVGVQIFPTEERVLQMFERHFGTGG